MSLNGRHSRTAFTSSSATTGVHSANRAPATSGYTPSFPFVCVRYPLLSLTSHDRTLAPPKTTIHLTIFPHSLPHHPPRSLVHLPHSQLTHSPIGGYHPDRDLGNPSSLLSLCV